MATSYAMSAAAAVIPSRLISSSEFQQRSHAFPVSTSSAGLHGLSLRCSRTHQSRLFCVATTTSPVEESVVEETSKDFTDLTPTSSEIESLIKEVCDQTKIAELDIKVGPFKLHMRRKIPAPKAAPAPPTAPVATALAPALAPASKPKPAAPAASTAAAPSAPKVSPLMSKAVAYYDLQKAAAESGVVFVNAPKVGLFRAGRLVKGKFGSPLCKEGQTVTEGQVVCYMEQFGTQTPVEAETSGVVIKVLWDDGVPVGYGDPLIAVKPKSA